MGAMRDNYGFVLWALHQKQFRNASSIRIGEYLRARTESGEYEYGDCVAHLNGHEVLGTDLYTLLRGSELDAWDSYCSYVEEGEEWQARIDNALGKRY